MELNRGQSKENTHFPQEPLQLDVAIREWFWFKICPPKPLSDLGGFVYSFEGGESGIIFSIILALK